MNGVSFEILALIPIPKLSPSYLPLPPSPYPTPRERVNFLLYFSFVCILCTVFQGLFALPLGVIGGLCSVIAAIL